MDEQKQNSSNKNNEESKSQWVKGLIFIWVVVAVWVLLFKLVIQKMMLLEDTALYIGITVLITAIIYYMILEAFSPLSDRAYMTNNIILLVIYVTGFIFCYFEKQFFWGAALILLAFIHFTMITEWKFRSPGGTVAFYLIALATGFVLCLSGILIYIGIAVSVCAYLKISQIIGTNELNTYKLYRVIKHVSLAGVVIIPVIGLLT